MTSQPQSSLPTPPAPLPRVTQPTPIAGATGRMTAYTRAALALSAVVMMCLSAYLFRIPDPNGAGMAVAVAVLGGVALVAARYVTPALSAPRVLPIPQSLSLRPLPVALGMALMAALMVIANERLSYALNFTPSARLQFVVLVVAVALVTWGMAGAPRLTLPRINRLELLALVLILLVALALRLWDLENSMRFFVDEIHLSTGTAYFWGDHTPRLLQPIGVLMPFPRIFPYWMWEATHVFGRTLTALRVVPALVGALTIASMYVLARQFFPRRTALAGAALLATFPPFLHFSRIALINIADPLFGALALAFFARGMRSGRQADYALAGMALGLAPYFYEGGKLLFPALMLVWLGGMTLGTVRIEGRRVRLRPPFALDGLLVTALTALLIALPVLVTLATQIEAVQPRLSDAGLSPGFWNALVQTGDFKPFLERLDNPFLIYTRLPDEARYYGGTTPLILPMFVPLFLLGIVHALAWRERRGAWVLVAWVALTSLGNSLLTSSTIAARFIIVLPALGLLMALGLTATLDVLLPYVEKRRAAIAAALVAVICTVQVGYYFGPHLTEFNRQFRDQRGVDWHDALLRTQDFPPYTTIHLIASQPPFTPQYADQLSGYLADEHPVRVLRREDVTPEYLLNLSRDIDHAFFVEAGDTGTRILIQQYFRTDPPQTSPYADVVGEKGTVLLYYRAG